MRELGIVFSRSLALSRNCPSFLLSWSSVQQPQYQQKKTHETSVRSGVQLSLAGVPTLSRINKSGLQNYFQLTPNQKLSKSSVTHHDKMQVLCHSSFKNSTLSSASVSSSGADITPVSPGDVQVLCHSPFKNSTISSASVSSSGAVSPGDVQLSFLWRHYSADKSGWNVLLRQAGAIVYSNNAEMGYNNVIKKDCSSILKKRRKKMNRHKYRKWRKRMRFVRRAQNK